MNLVTNIIGITSEDLWLDMRVEVTFEVRGEIHVSLFKPIRSA